jgi:starvation-inducible DNA-binding protein
MNPTRNDLKESVRKQMADLLNGCLVELIDLGMQAKQAHWNVKGPSFIALHELFDKVAEAVEEAVDTVAERAVALGGVATGTVQLVNERSELTPYPLKIKGGQQHVKALSMALAMCGRRVRAAIETATQAGDQGTADVFTEVTRALDQYLWFVEAHAGAKD